MKKIKTILSNNKAIKDEIFYPNEIYKSIIIFKMKKLIIKDLCYECCAM